MTKWEFGFLRGMKKNFGTSSPRFYRMTQAGLELVTDFKDSARGLSEQDAVAGYFAELGEQGWDIAASLPIGELDGRYELLFKRSKPETQE